MWILPKRSIKLGLLALAAGACSSSESAIPASSDDGGRSGVGTTSGTGSGGGSGSSGAASGSGSDSSSSGAGSGGRVVGPTEPDSGGGGSSRGAGSDAGADVGSQAGNFTCNLIVGFASSREWIDQGTNLGGFLTLMDGAGPSRWEAITLEHNYLEYASGEVPDPLRAPVWNTNFDPGHDINTGVPNGMISHTCAQSATLPDRVIFVAFAPTTDTRWNNFPNPTDPIVRANWVTSLEKVVSNIQTHYSGDAGSGIGVKRIELMTMIRGPGTFGPGMDCNNGVTDHEDVVMQWVDDAIAIVAQNHPWLVFSAPKFYVGACNWFAGPGPHFVPGGMPMAVAEMVANYYKAHQ